MVLELQQTIELNMDIVHIISLYLIVNQALKFRNSTNNEMAPLQKCQSHLSKGKGHTLYFH